MGSTLNWLRDALTENFIIKLLALVLAVTLVFFKREDQVTQVTANVKVELRHPADRVLMTPQVNMVQVTVRGDYGKLRRFSQDEIPPIVMNVSGVEDGQYAFDKRNIQVPPGLTVSEIEPSGMVLKFEGKTFAEVPVRVVMDGKPQQGFRVTQTSVTPKTVKVIGAKSVVAGLEFVKARPVKLDGRTQTASVQVELGSTPAYSRYAVDNQMVNVSFVIEENRGTRVVSNLPIAVLQPQGAAYAFEVSPKNIAITLNGPTRQLSMLDGENIDVYVDTRKLGKKGMYTRSVSTAVPEGIEVAEIKPSQVTLVRRQKQQPKAEEAAPVDAGVE